MYRLTIYETGEKSVDEFSDEDNLRDAVKTAMDGIENHRIKTFSVSWLSEQTHTKGFWEN